MTAEFNNVQKSNQIGIHVGIGVFNAVTHSCLGSEVDNFIWFEKLLNIFSDIVNRLINPVLSPINSSPATRVAAAGNLFLSIVGLDQKSIFHNWHTLNIMKANPCARKKCC